MPTTTESGPVRTRSRRPCKSWSKHRNSHARWTSRRGLDTADTHNVLLHQVTYDSGGRKVTETDPLGRVTRYGYDHANQLLTSTLLGYHNLDGTRRDVVLQRLSYDPAGHVISRCEGADLRCTSITIDAAGRISSTLLDPSGLARRTSYGYDANSNVSAVTRSDATRSEQTRYSYDDAGHVLASTVENGSADLVTAYGYDQRGLRISQTDPRGSAPGAVAADYTTTYGFDELGRLTTVTTPQASVEHDGGTPTLAQLVRRTGYDTFGNATHVRDARGNLTVTDYDKNDRMVAVHYPSYTRSDGSALTPTEQFGYNDVGNLTSRKDRRGFTYDYEFDFYNRMIATYDPPAIPGAPRGITRYRYDDAGHLLSRTDQRGAVRTWTYDDRDRPRTMTQVVRQPSGPALSYTSTRDYDDLSDVTYTRTPLGAETFAVFDAAGERTQVTDQAGKPWTSTFDVSGRQTSATDPLQRKAAFSYDLAGRLTSIDRHSPSGTKLTTVGRSYDEAGNLIGLLSPRQFTTSYGYDALGRLTSSSQQINATDTISTSYGYDEEGNLSRVTDGRSNSTVFSYTPWNQRRDVVEPATTAYPNPVDRTTTTDYDDGGLPVVEHQPGGVQISRTFDGLGRLTAESGSGGGTVTASRQFGYDLAGLPISVNHPNGTESFSYDDRGLPTQATGPEGDTSYGYDASGRLINRTDPAGEHTFTWTARNQLATATDPLTGTTRNQTFDDAGQLTDVSYSHGAQSSTRTLSWDNLGQLSADELRTAGGTLTAGHSYGYDLDGNRTRQTITLAGNPAAGEHLYAYDGAGRLSRWTKPGGATVDYGYDAAGNRTSAGTDTYTYDERNRLTSSPAGTYTWTARGTLASVTPTGGGTPVSYTFDGLGRQTAAAGVSYSYDGLDRLATRGSDTFSYAGTSPDPTGYGARRYARDPDGGLVAVSDGTTAALALANAHGDLAALHGADGQLSDTSVYDPFGQAAGHTGTMDTQLGFGADLTDPVTGQTMTARGWYDPAAAVFSAPSTNPGTRFPTLDAGMAPNRYTYGTNSPRAFLAQEAQVSNAGQYTGPAATAPSSTEGVDKLRSTLRTMHVNALRSRERAAAAAARDEAANTDFWQGWYELMAAVQSLGDLTVGTGETSQAPEKKHHSLWDKVRSRTTQIVKAAAPFVASIAATVACEVATVGVGTVGCLVIGGATYGAVHGGLNCKGDVGCLAKDITLNAVVNVVSGKAVMGVGKLARALAPDAVDALANGTRNLVRRSFSRGVGGQADTAGGQAAGRALQAGAGQEDRSLALSCARHSFAASTRVLMADGTTKPIKDVKVGDRVVATDTTTGRNVIRTVTLLHRHHDTDLADVVVRDENGRTATVHTTQHHRFWDDTQHKWVDAGVLTVGDALHTGSAATAAVAQVKDFDGLQWMYDLTVDEVHSYYVLAGEVPVLVHNCGGGSPAAEATLPEALTLGRNAEAGVDVYKGVRGGKDVYVGITNNLERRAIQHGDRFVLEQLTQQSVTRGEARAIEQAMIVRNPGFENAINSISPNHAWYQQAVDWGEAWLQNAGL